MEMGAVQLDRLKQDGFVMEGQVPVKMYALNVQLVTTKTVQVIRQSE